MTFLAEVEPRDVLPRSFYARDTITVARELLGKRLCHRLPDGEVLCGMIVETEAYLGIGDKAAHSYGDRRTGRTETMYAEAGTAYVYLIYGMYHCLNAVTREAGVPEAVLIRALAGEQGHARWAKHFPKLKPRQWLSGPGRLCRALHIDKSHNGLDLTTSALWIEDSGEPLEHEIEVGPRVGVDYAEEAAAWPLRFYLKGHVAVSKG